MGESGAEKRRPAWSRRSFVATLLKIQALLISTTAIRPLHARTSTLTKDPGFAANQAATLGRISYLLFPYPELGTDPYDQIVAGITQSIAIEPATKSLIITGIESLDRTHTGSWLAAGEEDQLDALRGVEDGPFFQYMLQTTKTQLFNDPRVWQHIGYEGSSLEKGGYLNRGLNDINWLDDV